jgi:methyl-accepting chemotaxis protein
MGAMGVLLVGLSVNSMRDALQSNAVALRVATITEISEHLFKMMIPTRNERGAENSALLGEMPVSTAVAADVATYRQASEDHYDRSMVLLTELGLPTLTPLVAQLKATHDTVVDLRLKADAAARQVKAARDATFVASYPKITQSLLDAILATSDRLEASLKMNDPTVDHFLAIKRAAWMTRLNLGLMAGLTQFAQSAERALTPTEILDWNRNQARAALAWSLVTEAAAREDAPRPIVEAVAAAEVNFTGPAARDRKIVFDTLAAGGKVTSPLRDVQRGDTINNGFVVTVADEALAQMVDRAHRQAATARSTLIFDGIVLVVALTLAGVGFVIVRRQVTGPIQAMTQAMRRLADRDMTVVIPGVGRHDEIGAMASAVQVFKDNALRAEAQEREQVEANQRRVAEDERIRREAEQAAATAAATLVVGSIGAGLEHLAAGDLTFRLAGALPEAYEALRANLNGTMEQLQDLVRSIVTNTAGIRSGTDEITQASDDLSRRTEHQAASLEQTAAALDEITATVHRTAEGAKQAQDVVARTGIDAQRSGEIVRQAVAAMDGIEQSSQQISQIIGVIDEIAFQTNLLALNAGVEAARAGEAGRGFAVVASEVRALAQRSAQAAKEIKTLISKSGNQVGAGVKLVNDTGHALGRIVTQVSELTTVVSAITASTQEQATALQEVNAAINQMDQVTQQNAAMVEQSTAASHSLAHEAAELVRLTERFQIGRDAAAVAAPSRAGRSVQRAPQRGQLVR